MRLFVAIELPPEVKDRLVPLCAGLHGAKWADTDTMHLTLRFLGDVDLFQAEDVADALGQVYGTAFPLELSGLGEFSSRGRAQVLWVGAQPSSALLALQGRVERAVRRAGAAPEKRKFHPHVTLARFGQDYGGRPNLGRHFAEHEPFRAGPFAVNEFVLFSSRLGSGGAVHAAEACYPLAFAREPRAGSGSIPTDDFRPSAESNH